MRRFAFLAAVFSLFAGAVALAAPPIRDVRAPAHLQGPMPDPVPPGECCGGEAPGELKLGRAKPKAQYDYGAFRCVVGQDNVKRYFPKLAKAVDTAKRAAPLPESVDWSAKAPNVIKRMYLNDKYGCCVISSRYHQIGLMSAADTGKGLEADDSEVLTAYQSACGRGDNGCDMSAVNVYQQKTGLKVKGIVHKADGSVSIDHTNQELVKTAIYVFGGLNVGMQLPNDWYASADGADWGVTTSRIVGGHEVQAFGYDAKGVWISTWGGKRRILWAAFTSPKWVDELYCTLSPDWYGSSRLAPNGIDADALKADLALAAGGKVPPLPDPNPTPPVPVPPVPVPPAPPAPAGDGFTGTIIYKDGKLVQVIPGATATDALLHADLKAAGVNFQVILDVLQLVGDIRANKGLDVILADVSKIISDLTAASKKKDKAPKEKTDKGEPNSAADVAPWALAA